MSILDSLTSSGGNKTKWTFEEELLFVVGIIDGTFVASEFEEQTGRSKAGYYAKRQGMLKFLKDEGCTTRDEVIEALHKKHGRKYEPDAQDEADVG